MFRSQSLQPGKMPVPLLNRKPLSSIPRLLQTIRPGRLLARRRASTTVTQVNNTSTTIPTQIQEEETIADLNSSHRQETSSASASNATVSSHDLTQDETQTRRLSVALGDAFEVPTKPSAGDEARLSGDEEEALRNTRLSWRPEASRAAGSPLPLFHTARQALQNFCAEPVVPDLEDIHADVSQARPSPCEANDEGHELVGGEVHDTTHHRSERQASVSGDMTSETTGQVTNHDDKQHVSFAETPLLDHSVHRQQTSRPPTPPVYPQVVASVHQTPGHWDNIGAKAALQHWIADFTVFRAEFDEGLKTYFSNWTDFFLFPGARKLLRATLQIPKALKVLFDDADALSPSELLAIERLDMDLRACMENSRQIYHCMTRRSRSATGPLQGKNLAWRKDMIKHDLGPQMERIADNLHILEQKANDTSRRMRQEANKAT